MKKLALLFVIALSGCRQLTPAEDVSILKVELKIARGKCTAYTLLPKYPRDAEVTESCGKLLK